MARRCHPHPTVVPVLLLLLVTVVLMSTEAGATELEPEGGPYYHWVEFGPLAGYQEMTVKDGVRGLTRSVRGHSDLGLDSIWYGGFIDVNVRGHRLLGLTAELFTVRSPESSTRLPRPIHLDERTSMAGEHINATSEVSWALLEVQWLLDYSWIRLEVPMGLRYMVTDLSVQGTLSGRHETRFETILITPIGFGFRIPLFWDVEFYGQSRSSVLGFPESVLMTDIHGSFSWGNETFRAHLGMFLFNVHIRGYRDLLNIERPDRWKRGKWFYLGFYLSLQVEW